ncbi:AI-2E family transporter [Haloglomus litoreum]|uniref:AI-2E family transporter n=1 Tax=Haloglomus litoreum TaxID=3034026 RepID=UPI0023E832D0|nr:AI-2E family transporter [Haloglomus sp. DT116]
MKVPVSKSRGAWWVIGAALAGFLLFVAYSFVGTFVLALFVYYGTRPFYTRLRRRLPSSSLAAALALLALALPVLILVTYALAIGLQEFQRFRQTADLGPLEEAVAPYLNVSDAVGDPATLLSDPSARRALEGAIGPALDSLGFVGNGLLHLFIVFAAAFYMLRDGPRLTRWAVRRFGNESGVLDSFLESVDTDLHSVYTGNLLNAVFTAGIGAVVYSLLNFVSPAGSAIPYPALVGLLAGAASLVPVVGMKLVYVPVGIYLFVVAGATGAPLWFPVAFAALSFVVVDTIPDLLLRPYVSGRNLHVGLIMFAYIFGPLLFGWYGIFLGPFLLVVLYHFAYLVLPELVDGAPIQPAAVDPGTSPYGPGADAAEGLADEPSDDLEGAESSGRHDGDPAPSPDGGTEE